MKFKVDFHSQMSHCRQELWLNLQPPAIPTLSHPNLMSDIWGRNSMTRENGCRTTAYCEDKKQDIKRAN